MPTTINPSNQTISQYNVQSGGANNTLNNIAPSTSGYVLTSNGGSAQPTFQPNPGSSGGLVFISTQTASNSASLIFDSTMVTATYKDYIIVVDKLIPSSPGNSNYLLMSWSVNNGSTYLSANYNIAWNRTSVSNLSVSTGNVSTSNIQFGDSAGVGSGSMSNISGQIQLFDMNVSANAQIFALLSGISAAVGNTVQTYTLAGARTVSTNVNNIKVTFSASNIASGSISLYGLVM